MQKGLAYEQTDLLNWPFVTKKKCCIILIPGVLDTDEEANISYSASPGKHFPIKL